MVVIDCIASAPLLVAKGDKGGNKLRILFKSEDFASCGLSFCDLNHKLDPQFVAEEIFSCILVVLAFVNAVHQLRIAAGMNVHDDTHAKQLAYAACQPRVGAIERAGRLAKD